MMQPPDFRHRDHQTLVAPENPLQPSVGRLVLVSSRRSPLIVMRQSTHFWDFLDRSHLPPLNRPRCKTIYGQRPVRAPVLVILEIPGEQPSRMSLMQDHHVVQILAMTCGTGVSSLPLAIG
jgi:hypothetical protein